MNLLSKLAKNLFVKGPILRLSSKRQKISLSRPTISEFSHRKLGIPNQQRFLHVNVSPGEKSQSRVAESSHSVS